MLLHDLYLPTTSSPILWCDNLSTIVLASNLVFHTRSKHIEADCYFIWERVVSKQIALSYIPIADQLADIFTKPLTSSRFHYLKVMGFGKTISLSLR